MTDLERAREIVTQFHLRSDFIRISLADARELTSNIAAALAAVREEDALVAEGFMLSPGDKIRNLDTILDIAAAIRAKGRE